MKRETQYTVRMFAGKLQSNPPSLRITQEVRRFYSKLVEQRLQVSGIPRGVFAPARFAEASAIITDDSEVILQRGYLLIPHPEIQRPAMNQDDRSTSANDFIVDVLAVDFREAAGWLRLNRCGKRRRKNRRAGDCCQELQRETEALM